MLNTQKGRMGKRKLEKDKFGEKDFGGKLPRVVRLNEKFLLFFALKPPCAMICHQTISLTVMRMPLLRLLSLL